MIVERIYNNKLQDYLQHRREEDTIYVTDLVRCPLKQKFENQYKAVVLKLVEETIEVSKVPRYSWECNYCQFNVICPNKKVIQNV